MRKFKLFLDPIEEQTVWLNKQAEKGRKLAKVGKLFYEFEPCKQGEYQYAVIYIGNKSNQERLEYERFLKEMNITFYEKAVDLGRFSIGKIKYRPFADKGGKFATSGGMINRELLILEKKNDGKPFTIYNSILDKAEALKEYRKPYSYYLVFLLVFNIYFYITSKSGFSFASFTSLSGDWGKILSALILFIALGTIPLIRWIALTSKIARLEKEAEVHE